MIICPAIKNTGIILYSLLALLLLSACGVTKIEPDSLRDFYEHNLRESQIRPNQTETYKELQNIISSFPGTRFASLAQIRLAEMLFSQLSSYSQSEEIENVDVFYRFFLVNNPNHELTQYVLNQMSQISYLKSKTGFFVSGTDPKAYQDSIQIYKNFQILYPNSVYFEDIKFFADYSFIQLASHEEKIGDWYFARRIYESAINRYKYILEKFPDYENKKIVSQKLIEALKLNLEIDLSEKYKQLFDKLYGQN